MSPLRVEAVPAGDELRFAVHGDLDIEGAEILRAAVPERAERPLVLDLTGVTFIDSTGLAAVMRLVTDAGGRVVAPPGSEARLSIELSGLADRLGVSR